MKIFSKLSGALLAGYLALPLGYADKPAVKLEKKEEVNVYHLESMVNTETFRYNAENNKPAVDGDFVLRNPGQTITGQTMLRYSLCIEHEGRTDCVDGKSEYPNDFHGEIRREFHLKSRYSQNKDKLAQSTPKLTIALERGKETVYVAEYYIHP